MFVGCYIYVKFHDDVVYRFDVAGVALSLLEHISGETGYYTTFHLSKLQAIKKEYDVSTNQINRHFVERIMPKIYTVRIPYELYSGGLCYFVVPEKGYCENSGVQWVM